jgi:hypothetical protein
MNTKAAMANYEHQGFKLRVRQRLENWHCRACKPTMPLEATSLTFCPCHKARTRLVRNPPRLRCMAELACDRLTAAPEEPWQEIDVNGDLANLESNAVSVKALRQVAMTLEAMPTPL